MHTPIQYTHTQQHHEERSKADVKSLSGLLIEGWHDSLALSQKMRHLAHKQSNYTQDSNMMVHSITFAKEETWRRQKGADAHTPGDHVSWDSIFGEQFSHIYTHLNVVLTHSPEFLLLDIVPSNLPQHTDFSGITFCSPKLGTTFMFNRRG